MLCRLALLFSFLSLAFPALGDVLRVPQDFPTIEAAAAVAERGDEIVLGPGVFPADVLFAVGDITIRGAGVGVTTIVPEAGAAQRAMLHWDLSREPAAGPLDVIIRDLTLASFVGGDPGDDDNYETPIEITGLFPFPEGRAMLANVRVAGAFRPFGGVVSLNALDEVIVEDCVFERNNGEAGALFISDTADVTVRRCVFLGNGGFGEPLSIVDFDTALVENCVVSGTGSRTTSRATGSLALARGGEATVRNCSFGAGGGSVQLPAGRFSQIDTFDVTATFIGCAFAAADELEADGRSSTVTFVGCVGPQLPPGNGNTITDPGYVDVGDPGPDNLWQSADDNPGDLTPAPGSPLLDAASGDAFSAFEGDAFGNPRLVDLPGIANTGSGGLGYLDIGAIEVQGGDRPCAADTNADGQVTPADFSAWITAFNTGSARCDQNGDGACTPADFSAWITNFNTGCG